MKVSNAGFDDINGFYRETKKNVFEMIRNDNDRVYQIAIDSETPFAPLGGDVWSIKRIDGYNDICIYINKNGKLIDDKNGDNNDNNDNDWECIVGNKPYPFIQTLAKKSNEEIIQDRMEKFKMEQNNKRKNWKTKSNVLYWSRKKQSFINGNVLKVTEGFVHIETKRQNKGGKRDKEEKDDEKQQAKDEANNAEIKPEFYEQICIEINSDLIQPQVDENFYKRRLKKKQHVLVWSRNELKFKQGMIDNIENDFVYIECGLEVKIHSQRLFADTKLLKNIFIIIITTQDIFQFTNDDNNPPTFISSLSI